MSEQTKSRYLDYLPAIYHEDPFLGRFLLPFEGVQTGFEELLADIDRYFAPHATDAEFLPWLSTWLALTLDETWDDIQRRRIIAEAIELYRWRGTVGGLKRYLEIYTGVVPEIHESAWPGGMQIGVASRIGGARPPMGGGESAEHTKIERMVRRQPIFYDYYVVETVATDDHPHLSRGQALRIYYRADRVRRVDVDFEAEEPQVEIEMLNDVRHVHRPATIARHDGLIDDHYILTILAGGETDAVKYQGDTVLIDEFERPYHFIVDVQASTDEWERLRTPDRVRSIRTILDLEKPAHTEYYLKVTQTPDEHTFRPARIGQNASIGLDMIIG